MQKESEIADGCFSAHLVLVVVVVVVVDAFIDVAVDDIKVFENFLSISQTSKTLNFT